MSATTDFVAAQQVNRRNTMVLLVVLTALAALVGYVIGWLLEGEASDAVPMWSRLGLFAAALCAASLGARLGSSAAASIAGARNFLGNSGSMARSTTSSARNSTNQPQL